MDQAINAGALGVVSKFWIIPGTGVASIVGDLVSVKLRDPEVAIIATSDQLKFIEKLYELGEPVRISAGPKEAKPTKWLSVSIDAITYGGEVTPDKQEIILGLKL